MLTCKFKPFYIGKFLHFYFERAMEIVAFPDILFLDEPTSGLDSTASLEILSSLKDLSRLGVTVIAVIHQARYYLFRLFDGVLLLGSGGKTVYQGSSRFALKYFQSLGFECPDMENPADFFMDVISGSVIPIGNSFFFILKIFLNLVNIHLLKEFIFLKKKDEEMKTTNVYIKQIEPKKNDSYISFEKVDRKPGSSRQITSYIRNTVRYFSSSTLNEDELKALSSRLVVDEIEDDEFDLDHRFLGMIPSHYEQRRIAFSTFDADNSGA
jgi:ABC-type multidrug transport system ATPase subunit